MAGLFRCLFGPRLSRIYQKADEQQGSSCSNIKRIYKFNVEGRDYQGNIFENFSDNLIRTAMFSISIVWSLGFYTGPFIALWMHRRGCLNLEYIQSYGRLASAITILFISLLFTRGLGRMMNNDYTQFIAILDTYKASRREDIKAQLAHYDFDFREWPVDFRYDDTVADTTTPRKYIEKRISRRTGMLDRLRSLPCGIVSYVAIHTFGRRLIYPGSLTVIHLLLLPMLMKGRARFIEKYEGVRYKLLTKDGNEIDSVFVDRRFKKKWPHERYLVICCEGNSGFYEYGITNTPLEAGFSVLGWNHPGFYGSTGLPYPDQELNAMDVVMQFAIHKLKFKPEHIVIYAWSIGGYTATWAAMNYPNLRGLILDATFDDLVPLALARMPPSWKPLVVRTVRDYMDLNNGDQLIQYNGPALLIRRTRDEMISTNQKKQTNNRDFVRSLMNKILGLIFDVATLRAFLRWMLVILLLIFGFTNFFLEKSYSQTPSQSLQTNRGNDLLIKLLQHRYPCLINSETLWLLNEWIMADNARRIELWTRYDVSEEISLASILTYIEEHSPSFPMEIGCDISLEEKLPMVLYVAQKHLMDYDSTHCAPLPPQEFFLPWTPFEDVYENWETTQESKL